MSILKRFMGFGIAVFLAFPLSGCLSDAQGRANIDLVGMANDDHYGEYLDAADVTAQECPELGCEQAVKSSQITVLKFPAVEEAADYEVRCDCHAIDPIVVQFDDPDITADQREEWIEFFSSINAEPDLG